MDEKNGKTPFAALTVATVLFAALGVMVYTQAPYKGARPSVPEIQEPSETIRARLWQDPFQAVLDHVKDIETKGKQGKAEDKEIKAKLNSIVAGVMNLIEDQKPNFTNRDFVNRLTNKEVKNKEVTVLAAMVWGGSYAELIESRIRQRYAVLAGLNRLKFYPEDPERIGCLKISTKKDDHEFTLTNIVPFEWLISENQKEYVLLLWLNENFFFRNPLAKLACLKKYFQAQKKNLKFKLLGPPSSTTLLEMIKENQSTDLEIYSATATADEKILIEEAKKDPGLKVDPSKLLGNIHRTILTDKKLAEELIEELGRRSVDLLSAKGKNHDHKKPYEKGNDYGGHRDHVVLVAEWDTDYGRLLPKTFLEVLKEKHNEALKKKNIKLGDKEYLLKTEDIKWIHRFSYLRGIDGKLPGEPNGSTGEQKKKESNSKEDRDIKKLEEPVGKSQYDYLRRLAENICRLNDKLKREDQGSIKAIGVLGNDFYDKYLVLQALGQRLPDRIFFTTDLDANYLHPANIQWTRNLVVASTFDLQLRKDFQEDVPPFRDAYQTSVFAATLRAFNLLKEYDFINLKPRIFEIGRRNAIDLTNQSKICVPINQALPVKGFPSLNQNYLLIILGVLSLLVIVFWLSCNWDPKGRNLSKSIQQLFTNKYIISCLIFFSIILLFICYLHYSILKIHFEEPFYLTEGVSIWPTVIIRVMVIVLSLILFAISLIWLKSNENEIYDEFCLTIKCKEISKINWSRLDSLNNKIDVNTETDNYFQNSIFYKRLVWIVPIVAIYFLLCYLTIKLFGGPTSPVRGDVSRTLNDLVLRFTIISFLLLTFFVLDTIMLCRRFVADYYVKQPQWPPYSLHHFTQKWIKPPDLLNWMGGTAEEALSNWMLIKLIAKRTEVVGKLIFFPFLIWFLMFVSRLHYFDNYHTPLGLVIVISMSALLAWACALILRRSAEKLRAAVIERLSMQMIEAYSTESPSQADLDRIQYVLNEVKAIKSGAFAPYLQHPVLQSLLVPIGGISGLKLLEFLANLG